MQLFPCLVWNNSANVCVSCGDKLQSRVALSEPIQKHTQSKIVAMKKHQKRSCELLFNKSPNKKKMPSDFSFHECLFNF